MMTTIRHRRGSIMIMTTITKLVKA
jgi:hypothetical protein